MKLNVRFKQSITNMFLIPVLSGIAGSAITLIVLYFEWGVDDWSCLGIWAGALGAGIFAYVQIKQNNRAYHHEISERYIDSYSNLIEALDSYKDINVEYDENRQLDTKAIRQIVDKTGAVFDKITKVKNHAKLTLSNDIYLLANEVYNDLFNVITIQLDYTGAMTSDVYSRVIEKKTENINSCIIKEKYQELLKAQEDFRVKYEEDGQMLTRIETTYQNHTRVRK